MVRYDRPGTGLSDRGSPPRDRDEEVAVLAGLVDAVGADRVHLLGASSGCPVAATYAADHPDRVDRLVLYGGYARGADIAAPAARESMVGLVETHWGLGLPGAGRRLPARRDRPRARGVRALPAAVGLARRGGRSAAVGLRAGRAPTAWPR